MGLLGNAIAKGVTKAVSNAVEEGVKKVAAPKIEEAAANASAKVAKKVDEFADQAATSISQSTAELKDAAGDVQVAAADAGEVIKEQTGAASVGEGLNALGSLFGNYANAAMGFANSVAANAKVCTKCGAVVMDAEQKFCPECGAKLPENTLGQDAICPECGYQNNIETKFCAKCGAKLPKTLAEEKQFKEQWAEKLSVYPVWDIGGKDFHIGVSGDGYVFSADGVDDKDVAKYIEVLKANGFVQVSEGDDDLLYKMVDGQGYACDTEHAFEVETLSIYFSEYTPKPVAEKEEKKAKASNFEELIDQKSKEIQGNVDSAKEAAKNVINFFKKG